MRVLLGIVRGQEGREFWSENPEDVERHVNLGTATYILDGNRVPYSRIASGSQISHLVSGRPENVSKSRIRQHVCHPLKGTQKSMYSSAWLPQVPAKHKWLSMPWKSSTFEPTCKKPVGRAFGSMEVGE